MSEYEQKSFSFLLTYFDTARKMNPKNRLELYDAMGDYIFLGIDREDELADNPRMSQAYFGYLGIKGLLKMSKLRAKAGSITKQESNDNQTVIKSESKRSTYIDIEKDKKKKEIEQTAPHSCPKCGGLLDKTGIHRQRGNGDEYMHVCQKCGGEVWL